MRHLCNFIALSVIFVFVSCHTDKPEKNNNSEKLPTKTDLTSWDEVEFDVLSKDSIETPSGLISKWVFHSKDSNCIKIVQSCQFQIQDKNAWTKGIEQSVKDTNNNMDYFHFDFSKSDSVLTSVIR